MNDAWGEVDQLVARGHIEQLAIRYAAALAHRDVEAMVELYVDDAQFGPYGEGPEALRQLTRESLDGAQLIVLLTSNHLIQFDSPEHAHGEVWAHCFAHTVSDGYVEQLVKYEDRYACVDGVWRFARRRHRLLFGRSPRPSPFDQDPADWPTRQIGVGDLALSSEPFARWYRHR